MRTHRVPICFVGPLPPPVHGFAEINSRMLQALQERHPVVVFDMAPRSNLFGFVGAWSRFLLCLFRHRPNALYLALSGGHRQWIDLVFVLLARTHRVPIFAHHHSFSYLNEDRLSSTVLLRALRGATHIVLCTRMGEQLAKAYGIELSNMRVLSNAAFLEDIDAPVQVKSDSAALRVGFLSNITAEKGIFEFFAVLRGAAVSGLALRGVVGGPVDPRVRPSFDATLAACANVEHVGAVYGAAKKAFFANIDVLFFPTRYPNEAEPVTILEALGQGVPVIAFSRGCIEGMVPGMAGAVFPYSDAFVRQATEALGVLAKSPAQLENARNAAKLTFEAARAASKIVLEGLVAEMGAK